MEVLAGVEGVTPTFEAMCAVTDQANFNVLKVAMSVQLKIECIDEKDLLNI